MRKFTLSNSFIKDRDDMHNVSRHLYVSVAVLGVLVGFAVLCVVYFTKSIVYNERVINEKSQTLSKLENNNKNAKDLESQVSELSNNSVLKHLSKNGDALSTISDAIPTYADNFAVGLSIERVVLANIPGVSINSIKIGSVNASKVDEENALMDNIPVSFSIKVDADSKSSIDQVFSRVNSSIRQINVQNVTVATAADGSTTINFDANVFYIPAKNVDLGDEVVQ